MLYWDYSCKFVFSQNILYDILYVCTVDLMNGNVVARKKKELTSYDICRLGQ